MYIVNGLRWQLARQAMLLIAISVVLSWLYAASYAANHSADQTQVGWYPDAAARAALTALEKRTARLRRTAPRDLLADVASRGHRKEL